MTTVVLIRHGETDWNRSGRMQGWAPVPLNETGRQQADAAGAYLAREYDVDRVHASDLLRARETTELLTEHVEPADEPTFGAAWRERDIGVYQGLTYEELYERFPEFALGEDAAHAAERRPDSGESLVDVHERATAGFAELLAAAGPRETHLVIAHGGPLHLVLGHVKGMDVRTALLEHHQHNCALNELHHDPETGETRVVRENETPWRE